MFIFCRKSFKFFLIVCMGMFINIGWATPPKDFIMFVGRDIEVANIGEDLLVPVIIKQAKAWESASISFTVKKLTSGNTDPNVVHIKTLKLPAKINTPYTVYVPLTVTGEGHFKVIGKVHMNLAGNRLVYADLPEWTYPLDFEIFALNGKYAVASVAGDTELAKFLVEQEHPQLRPLMQQWRLHLRHQDTDLSEHEKELIRALIKEKERMLLIQLYQKYPIDQTSTMRQPSQSTLRRNERIESL